MPGNEGTRNRSMLEQLLDRSKRNGSRKTAAKEGSKAKTSERGIQDEEEFHQLRREFRQLEVTRAELSEKENELEEQLRSLRREMEQVQRNSLPKRERLEAVCKAGRSRTPVISTSSQRRCGRKSPTSSTIATSSPWL